MLTEGDFSSESLCVVGNLNRDVKLAPLRHGSHLFEDGENRVAWVAESIGGGGANAAAAAARLGARSALLGKVGADALGRRLKEVLCAHGVTVHVREDPAVATGTSVCLSFDNGHRHFLSCLPNNESLSIDDLDLGVLAKYGHLYRADIWFSEAMLFEGNRKLFEAARTAGLATSIDLNWDPQWTLADEAQISRRKKAVRDLLPLVTLAHGNIRELNRFADSRNLGRTLKNLERWGAEAVLIHMGHEGAGFYCRGTLTVERPVPVTCCVNTTGSGDVLSVCMMLLHHRGSIPVKDRLHLGNRIVAEFIEGKRALIPSL
jgi:sugar/nucleoside kinase (ribokinase family)